MTVYSESCNIKYWFDGKPEDSHLCENTITDIDVSALSDGMHSIHMLAESNGKISRIETRYFVKVSSATNESDEQITCKYWFDGKPEDSHLCENTITDIDVSALSDGMHSIHMLAESNGKISRIETLYFVKVSSETSSLETKCLFFIDDVLYNSYVLNGASEEKIHCDLDVTQITDGIHNLSYYLINNQGKVTRRSSSIFVKTPIGGHGIAKWMYRLNGDKNTDNVKVLKSNVDTLNIVELLSVEPYPIRSSCFEFRVEENKPVLYAKNDIEFWFWDALKNNVGFKKQYVDESVRQELKADEIAVLKSNVVTRVNRPAENEIKWYKFDAEEGDSMVVNVDKACSIDVFSPSGKSVYSAMGAESVKASGTHLYETGTFYVAIHDMTAKYGNEINLNFQLIDKYAVLSQNVHKVGNGGFNTIKYNGNGFFDLYAVDLVSVRGDTIHSEDLRYDTNSCVYVTFNFENAKLGTYDAIFHFVDEDKIVEKNIIVEQSEKIELVTNISYPATYLRGNYTTYTISIENNSNMTAYYVPIELKLVVNSIENISDIKFEGDITSLKSQNELLNDSIDEDIKQILLEVSESIDDLSQFVVYQDSVSNTDYGLSQVVITLPPYSKKQIEVSILTNGVDVSLYAYVANDWYPMVLRNESRGIKPLWTEDQRDWMCCQKERFKCSANIVANIASLLMPPGAGCATSLALTGLNTAYDVWCSDGATVKERWDKYIKSNGNSLVRDLIQSAVSCVTWFYAKQIKKLREDLRLASRLGSTSECDRIMVEIATAKTMMESTVRGIYNGVCTAILGYECIDAFTKKEPNCPPNPGGGGGTSTPVNSLDPNDIHGYVAESGSKYIGKDVKTINYMIEFENDSTFATSSAHKILLVDTLDVDVLDVTSVVPKSMKIGKHDCDFTKKASGYVATIDMRSEINAIAQISVNVTDKGVMNCEIVSLDPMTMEPTDDIMAGILPVNDASGRGQGMLTFMVDLKSGLKDGTEISNKADIIFDSNEPISTPYWINETDYVNPVSKIGGIENVSDTTINIYISGEDERSGVWRYTLYVQPGDGSDWFLVKENIEADTCEYKVYPDSNYGFCVVATDKAGNIEEKQLVRGYSYCNGVATSGLQDINLDNSDDKANDETMYDLLGRKVKNPSQGLFVKKKQKVLIK